MEKPKVSIIIPTYNSGKTLSKCLESVYGQSYPFFEVIIVDNYSNDNTVEIAKKFGAKVIQAKSNPAAARNIGVANSTGKYVLFVDSDQILSPTVIEECVKKCESGDTSMVKIPEVFIGMNFWSRCSALWKNCYQKAAEHRFRGEPRFFVKNHLIQAKMFDERLTWAEDQELYNRMKAFKFKELSCINVLFHIEPDSVGEIMFKNFRYGESMPFYSRVTGQQFFLSVIKDSMLTLVAFFKKHGTKPLVVMGCVFLLFLKAYAIALGLLKTYLFGRLK